VGIFFDIKKAFGFWCCIAWNFTKKNF
jgi:hypothetical protein